MSEYLLISPHVDDEVLGCGGILDSRHHVYFCGVDESMLRDDKDPTSVSVRLKELEDVARYLGFTYEYNPQGRVNHYTEIEFINPLEDVINRTKPRRVLLPHPGYNQDHRVIYHAAMIALRPHDRNHFVDEVMVYEAVHDTIWTPNRIELNCFVEIDIERKIAAYELYTSQVRGMRSSDLIRKLAAVRGAAAGCAHAEAFQILRWCERLPPR